MTKRIIYVILFISYSVSIYSGSDNCRGAGKSYFVNSSLLDDFFEKLLSLENDKQGKVNIVHIGDSHIQADFFTHAIRQRMQQKFGNAGYGFTFPYSLAKTNANNIVKYGSNVNWSSAKVLGSPADLSIGLGGINLRTSSDGFNIKLSVSGAYSFNTVKIVHPAWDSVFTLNGLDIPPIAEGVPSQNSEEEEAVLPTTMKQGDFTIVQDKYVTSFSATDLLREVNITANENKAVYTLNGIVLEKDDAGVLYHNIGVNGAKLSDYNKQELFFEQLSVLSPDLVIVSFGTNESFGKLSASSYMKQVDTFVANVMRENPYTTILFTTPAPSLLKRKILNHLIQDYTDKLTGQTSFPVWDMLRATGGIKAPLSGRYGGYMAKDKVHYKREGYVMQANLFVDDLLCLYEKYKYEKNLNN
ncbi:GDSL-type esterase/lipase family protein [Dysgonomonas sp. 520]|uniref:SGNH/GDSL hydrolase family protein n=1 Tax=Dysgonomonas sp. 520 TaxID=2302931 RepID=UPI0013D7CC7C|nr:GDSL-type esterase/lipase family protein [Dysgonomonas sp. 520]NDW08933.1 hypothetical protein [Dysgonomonas sp. 520]